MKSRRSWLIGLALGAVLSFGAVNAQAQGPRLFSYQGLVLDKNTNFPVPDGAHSVAITLYDAAASGTVIYSETQTVTFFKGVFDLAIGATNTPTNQLPANVDFSKPYWI